VENNHLHDRGRGPEIVGTRITVYNLLPHFLDSTATEAYICQLYQLTPEQVAAARAHILSHADTVLAKHLEIEQRMAAGNPPEVMERAKQTHDAFVQFKNWLAQREQTEAQQDAAESSSAAGEAGPGRVPTFREWLEGESRAVKGS